VRFQNIHKPCAGLFTLVFFFIASVSSFAQSLAGANDLKVQLHEESINKIFRAIGNIEGSAEYEVMLFKGNYNWTMMNPHIILRPGKGDFLTDVRVKAGLIDYTSQVVGNVDIWYDVKTNLINVKVTKAIFEIYTKILGSKVHIKYIDLAQYLTDPITFEGPMTLNTDMTFTMPDGKTKKIFIWPSKCELKVLEKIVEVVAELEFSEKLFVPPTQPQPQPLQMPSPK
jgi:hypothetical protein